MYLEYRHINFNHEQGQHYKMEGPWQTECDCVSRKYVIILLLIS